MAIPGHREGYEWGGNGTSVVAWTNVLLELLKALESLKELELLKGELRHNRSRKRWDIRIWNLTKRVFSL